MQMLALIVTNRVIIPHVEKGGTLIVCPLSIMTQWASEIEAKVKKAAGLTYFVHHGSGRPTSADELRKYDVVITTYGVMTEESRPDKKQAKKSGMTSGGESSGGRQKRGALAQVHWQRLVLDEAQCIRNGQTVVHGAACSLRADRRWALSGTPVQNSYGDLRSIFAFLRYHDMDRKPRFKLTIADNLTKGCAGYERARNYIDAVMIRRKKSMQLEPTACHAFNLSVYAALGYVHAIHVGIVCCG